jgi:hypothetical protein
VAFQLQLAGSLIAEKLPSWHQLSDRLQFGFAGAE